MAFPQEKKTCGENTLNAHRERIRLKNKFLKDKTDTNRVC